MSRPETLIPSSSILYAGTGRMKWRLRFPTGKNCSFLVLCLEPKMHSKRMIQGKQDEEVSTGQSVHAHSWVFCLSYFNAGALPRCVYLVPHIISANL